MIFLLMELISTTMKTNYFFYLHSSEILFYKPIFSGTAFIHFLQSALIQKILKLNKKFLLILNILKVEI